jgi:phosphoenolpyruvate carboxykinase (ATP)
VAVFFGKLTTILNSVMNRGAEFMSTTEKAKVAVNLTTDELINAALARKEGVIAANGALAVNTGKRTGRSPKDRFIVKEETTQKNIDWGEVNQPIGEDKFAYLWNKAQDYIADKDQFVSYLQVGADDFYNLPVKVTTEYAWHNLFARDLFIIPETPQTDAENQWSVLNVPNLKLQPHIDGSNSDGIVCINFKQKKVLIMGIAYAGEMKKAMFSVLNYLLPEHKVLPMHCAANTGEQGDTALFFGLSGTGKTTLSADPERFLIGDDEHGWSEQGVFNFEGGCYAKCIDLTAENEPMIYHSIRHGAIMENVVLADNGEPDYKDDRHTQNTRAAYPREHIEKRVPANQAGQPNAVLFLTCDLFGVLPPVAVLSKEQAAYHFLSGYTALVGSTEMGQSSGIRTTFSTCFGAPFFSRPPQVYADLLMHRTEQADAQVYLVNTGWFGGPYGQGQRFPIPVTRAIVRAILSDEVRQAELTPIPELGLYIPQQLASVDDKYLHPHKAWSDLAAYKNNCQALIKQFEDNFKRFDVAEAIKNAGPKPIKT